MYWFDKEISEKGQFGLEELIPFLGIAFSNHRQHDNEPCLLDKVKKERYLIAAHVIGTSAVMGTGFTLYYLISKYM